MNDVDPIQTYLVEAADLLGLIEDIALDLEKRPDDSEAINRMFRAFHTLKGSGAMFGFNAVAAFTHHIETTLDTVRSGALVVDAALLSLILAARDQISVLLENPGDAATARECERIISELGRLSGRESKVSGSVLSPTVEPTGASGVWQIFFRPAPKVALSGIDPMVLLDELRRLGSCIIKANASTIPSLDRIQPEECYLFWRITLTTDHDLNTIKDVFLFVADDCEVSIEAVDAGFLSAAPSIPQPVAPATASTSTPTAMPVAPAPTVEDGPARRAVTKDATVRVPSSKLDRLVNLVGELVMNQSRLTQVSSRLGDSELASPVEAIERLIGELRDSVLEIRMMPIGSTFGRFKRLVFDLSRELGKEIELVTQGAETELDKTVLDRLGDPLVHLIRNCIDHGIEFPDERTSAGKARRGTIRLTATHAGAHVVIAIQDDGRGLNTESIRSKALEKGLISHDAVLSETELFNLIFLPGFSTAKSVTSVSGRGVGMDVVKKEIDSLRGTVQVESKHGAGTIVSLKLPLTLAIIDGLLVKLEGDQFILPMSSVTENVELHRSERALNNGRNIIAVRGELIPYIRLRELFDTEGEGPDIEKIVISSHGDQRVGIVVDQVLGSHQTVIQPLGRFYQTIEVASGATIMGDGRVALILDLPGLIGHAARKAMPSQDSLSSTANARVSKTRTDATLS